MDGENDPTIWSTKLKGKGPDTSSPVKVDSRIYLVTDNGYEVLTLRSDEEI